MSKNSGGGKGGGSKGSGGQGKGGEGNGGKGPGGYPSKVPHGPSGGGRTVDPPGKKA